MANSINASRYLECSAKCNRGVKECFEQAAKIALSGISNSTTVTIECILLSIFLTVGKNKDTAKSRSWLKRLF